MSATVEDAMETINEILAYKPGGVKVMESEEYMKRVSNILKDSQATDEYKTYLKIWLSLFYIVKLLSYHSDDKARGRSIIKELKYMDEVSIKSTNKIRGFYLFIQGEFNYNRRGIFENRHTYFLDDFPVAVEYYKQANILGFIIKKESHKHIHDYFSPGDEDITADVDNDPRLKELNHYIKHSGISPEGQNQDLKNARFKRGIQIPKYHIKNTKGNTKGNTNAAYRTTNKGLTRRNNIASEKRNVIKRVWVTLKDITKENDREGVIDVYDEILHLPKNPKDLTNEQTKLFIPTLPRKPTLRNRINPFKTFHKFTRATNENITRKMNVQNNKGVVSLPTHEYIRRTQTLEMIENYQIMAYNELIGLLLVLMEKANDKFLQENEFQRGLKKTGQKFRSLFRTDEAGIISLDTLSENYVQSLIGYNMEESIHDAIKMLRDIQEAPREASPSDKRYTLICRASFLMVTILIVTVYVLIEKLEIVPGPPTRRLAPQRPPPPPSPCLRAPCFPRFEAAPEGSITRLKESRLNVIPSFFKETIPEFFTSKLPSTFINDILPSLLGEIAIFQATSGVFTAVSLSYKIYKMYRSRKRAFLLKDIFKQIHIALFKNNNTQKFIDIKDEVYFFKNLSEKEKGLLLTRGSKIDMQTSDKELSEYLSQFLSARKDRLESTVIKTFAKGNPNNEKLLEKAMVEGNKILANPDKFTINPMHAAQGEPVKNGNNGNSNSFVYDPTKSKSFKTNTNGSPLPEGWTRETQDGKTWYYDPQEKAHWESPLKPV